MPAIPPTFPKKIFRHFQTDHPVFGVAPDSDFAHIVVSLNAGEGGAVWIGPVTDEEYERIN